MKIRILLLTAMLSLAMGITAKAQTKVEGSVTFANDQGLGYSLPVVDFGVGVDHYFDKHFEVDASGAYAIAHKAVLGNGHEVIAGLTPIVWVNSWFGITGEMRYVHLYTSAYDKGTILPTSITTLEPSLESFVVTPGVVFRTSRLLPSRLWLDTLIPMGTINQTTGIESNRETGVEFSWEASMYDIGPGSFRMTINPAIYHGYSEGNPECDGTYGGPITCPRQGWLTYAVAIGFKYVWPKDENKTW